ncbi:hypothetical protein G7Z17_g6612 [Cylindrodendrum hubeiense]|uniref:MYND-type domain-containing protein n=1 Tax=Cylindrodendrum hubeiense TaxID=595255 RepID=A0A9P5H9K1_9HYPO|nr:hypothetical protein G7Z17_g6612 [Cylindrodendrum hubeiense]
MTDYELDYVPITEPRCPVRHDDGAYCLGTPQIPCPKCLLLAYCSRECRESHWFFHRHHCVVDYLAPDNLSDLKSPDDPWEDPWFWAKHAATDVLSLEKNEGKEFDGALDLLLVGESSLRHLIYSICKLPDTATIKITATINETSAHHLTRLVLTVLILTDDSYDPMTNAETVVHLWYSAMLPSTMFRHMEIVAAEPLLAAMNDLEKLYDAGNISTENAFPITMPRGGKSVVIDINRAQWSQIIQYLKRSKDISIANVSIVRAFDCKKYSEPLPQVIKRMTPVRATGMMRWRSDGLLLPYGHPREEFDTLNPLFFQDHIPYPMGATQEPLAEWPIELLDHPCGPAQNDVYGKMFYYVRDLCLTFQKRIKILQPEIRIISMYIHELPSHHTIGPTKKQFDRIEAAHYWDRKPFLTLISLGALLRHEDENPNATILTLTRESVIHQMDSVKKDLEAETQLIFQSSGTKLDELAPPLAVGDPEDTPAALRRKLGLVFWRNWDRFSEHYLSSPHYFHLLNMVSPYSQFERGLTATGFLGLSLKPKNTITRRWPNRLVHNRKDAPTLRDFNRRLGWGDNLPERWLEWKKFDDISPETWNKLFSMALAEDRARANGGLAELGLEDTIKGILLNQKAQLGENEADDDEQEMTDDVEDTSKEEKNKGGSVDNGNEESAENPKPKKKKKNKNKKGTN